MRIDAHHSWNDRHPLEIFQTILQRNRFDAAIAVAEAFLPRPHILRVDLGDPDLPRLLDECQRQPLCCGVCHRLTEYNLRGVFPGLFELAHRRLPLDLELCAPQLPLVPDIAAGYPTLRIVIDHLGRPPISAPLDHWARDLERAARHPNVFCKASSLTTLGPPPWKAPELRPAVQHALAVFGSHRLMFGSDWPNCLPAASWKETLAAFTQTIGALPTETREELLGGTAQRFYQIANGTPA